MNRTAVILCVLAWGGCRLNAADADNFVFAQLDRPGRWDPYPDFWEWSERTLRQLTRLEPDPRRRVVRLQDPALFESPFVVIGGRGPLIFSPDELERMRRYLSAGGFFFFDDADGHRHDGVPNTAELGALQAVG